MNSVHPDGRRARWTEHRRARREDLVVAAVEAVARRRARTSPSTTSPAAPASRRRSSTATSATRTSWSTPSSSGSPPGSCCPGCSASSPSSTPTTGRGLRAVIAAFVSLIEDEPALYRFAYAQTGRSGRADLVAATEHEIAEALAGCMADAARRRGPPAGAGTTWAYGVVGMVQLATHWWSTDRACRRASWSSSWPPWPTAASSALLPPLRG